MQTQITVRLKKSVLDPQGKAIQGALKAMGFADVATVRQGKVFDLDIEGSDAKAVEEKARDMARKLLANTVIEDFEVRVIG